MKRRKISLVKRWFDESSERKKRPSRDLRFKRKQRALAAAGGNIPLRDWITKFGIVPRKVEFVQDPLDRSVFHAPGTFGHADFHPNNKKVLSFSRPEKSSVEREEADKASRLAEANDRLFKSFRRLQERQPGVYNLVPDDRPYSVELDRDVNKTVNPARKRLADMPPLSG
jgi:hypothetical protein